jgi:hypothetical protein
MSNIVLPTNQEDREVYLREHDAGGFIEAVRKARKADTLILTIDAFRAQPEVLYVALDYAKDEGVAVTMAPPS